MKGLVEQYMEQLEPKEKESAQGNRITLKEALSAPTFRYFCTKQLSTL